MRRLFIERARRFFETQLGLKGDAVFNSRVVEEKAEATNIQRSKIVGLLPEDDLRFVASQPCFVHLRPGMR